jgi:copper chaperone CopZ
MKNVMRSLIAMAILLTGFGNLHAQNENTKTEQFKVYGNCGMCEKRIEKAAKSVDGVSAADWDQKTKMLEVKYDTSKTDLDKIEQAVADVGHDTDSKKADNKTYNALPGCCKYDRSDDKKEEQGHDGHQH